MDEIRRCDVPNKSVAIWWLGQNGFIFKSPEGTLVGVDLYLTDSCAGLHPGLNLSRMVPVLMKPEELNIVREVIAMREKAPATMFSSTSLLSPSQAAPPASMARAVKRVFAAMNEMLNEGEWKVTNGVITEHERDKTVKWSKSIVDGNVMSSSTYAMKADSTKVRPCSKPAVGFW